jgi:hypothetical protein
MKLDIYNSKRKDAADDRMTDEDITDRFENDVAKEEGDWGKADKKFAPGPTYEEEMDQLLRAILIEAQSFSPKQAKHTENDLTACSVCGVKGHVPAKHFGKALSGKNNQPVRESKNVEPKVVGHFIQTHLPSGKEHKGAMMDTHLRELGSNGRLSTGERVTKDTILNHWNAQQPKTYKYRWMKESEDGPIKKCPDCGKVHAANVPCAGKEVLMGDEMCEEKKNVKCINCKRPFSYTPKDDVEMRQLCSSCSKKKFRKEDMNEGKKVKKFDKTAHIKAIARNTVGAVPKGQVIVPKDQKKKLKHKVDWRKSLDEAVAADTKAAHQRAAQLHDAAAQHSKGDSRMIDRPYKDACDASFGTHHAEISKHIRHATNGRQGGYTPDLGSRSAFHSKLAQMHREAANE